MPSDMLAHHKDLFLPFAVLTVGSESALIPICNPPWYPVTILRGETLGFVQAVTCIEDLDVHDGATHLHLDIITSVSSTPPSAVFDNAIAADLSPSHRTQLLTLLNEFVSSFDCSKPSFGYTTSVSHTINTSSHIPLRQRASPEEQQSIAEQVDDMLQRGVIQPSQSPWLSYVVLVHKKRWHHSVLYRLSPPKQDYEKRRLPTSSDRQCS